MPGPNVSFIWRFHYTVDQWMPNILGPVFVKTGEGGRPLFRVERVLTNEYLGPRSVSFVERLFLMSQRFH